MQIYEILLIVAGALGAISSIILFGKKAVKIVKRCISFFTDMKKGIERLEKEQSNFKTSVDSLNTKTDSMQKKVNTIERHTLENYMRELQIIVMSEEMPLGERLKAGEEYVGHGWNGEIKAKYHVLQQKYEEEARKHETG